MTLRQMVAFGEQAGVTESFFGLQPGPTSHPPSLRNPQKVKVPVAQDGWHKGDSKAQRRRAIADLEEIHKRLRRQGKPEIAHVAQYPLFPNYREII